MKKGLTEMVFILDRSGSMSGLESDTIGGYNAMLEKQNVRCVIHRDRGRSRALNAGLPGMIGLAVCLVVYMRTKSLLPTMAIGMAAVVVLRRWLLG